MSVAYKSIDAKLKAELQAFADLQQKVLLHPEFKSLVDLVEESEDTQRKLHDYEGRLRGLATKAHALQYAGRDGRQALKQKGTPEADVSEQVIASYGFTGLRDALKKKLSLIINSFLSELMKTLEDDPKNYAPADRALVEPFVCFLIIAEQPRWGIVADQKMATTILNISTLLKPDPSIPSVSKTGFTLKKGVSVWADVKTLMDFQGQIATMVKTGKAPADKPDIAGPSSVLSRPAANAKDASKGSAGTPKSRNARRLQATKQAEQQLAAELKALKEQYTKLQQQKDAQAAEVKQLREELQRTQQAKTAETRGLQDRLSAAQAEFQKKITQSETEIKRLKEDLQKAQQALSTKTAEAKDLQAKLSAATATQVELQKKVAQSAADVKQLTEKLQKAQTAKAADPQALLTLQTQLSAAQTAQQELQSLKQAIAQSGLPLKTDNPAILQTSAKVLLQEMQTAKTHTLEAQSKVASTQTELHAAQHKLTLLQAELKQKGEELYKTKIALMNMENERDTARANYLHLAKMAEENYRQISQQVGTAIADHQAEKLTLLQSQLSQLQTQQQALRKMYEPTSSSPAILTQHTISGTPTLNPSQQATGLDAAPRAVESTP